MPRRPYNVAVPKVANRLRYWRQQRGMTIEQLAELVGMEERTVQKYETQNRLRVSQLPVFAAALDVDPTDLIATEDALDAEAREIAERYRLLDAQTKKLVKGVFEQVEEFRGRPGGKKAG